MSFIIPAPIFVDLMSISQPDFDPTTGVSGDRSVAEGPEPLDNASVEFPTDAEGRPLRTEGWFIPTRSRFEDIQPETIALHEQLVADDFPTPAPCDQEGGTV